MGNRTAKHNFEGGPPKHNLSIRFGDFRGEDVKVYDIQQTDGCQVMVKAHMAFGRVS